MRIIRKRTGQFSFRPETGFYEELSKAILQGIIAGADLEKFSEWEKFFEERMINYEVHVQDTKRSEEEEIGGRIGFRFPFREGSLSVALHLCGML